VHAHDEAILGRPGAVERHLHDPGAHGVRLLAAKGKPIDADLVGVGSDQHVKPALVVQTTYRRQGALPGGIDVLLILLAQSFLLRERKYLRVMQER
jgi:hypothetical protein